MKERPIIFSTDMVRAILDGRRKTQTRRVIKPQPPIWAEGGAINQFGSWDFGGRTATRHQISCGYPCPYGQVGDGLWVRETFAVRTDGVGQILYKAAYTESEFGVRWKPSIHMSRKDSRILLEITGVRVARLQEITKSDQRAEGVGLPSTWDVNGRKMTRFGTLWDFRNAKRGYGWGTNCWVWIISFKEVK